MPTRLLRRWQLKILVNLKNSESCSKIGTKFLILGLAWPIDEPWQQPNPSHPIPLSSARARLRRAASDPGRGVAVPGRLPRLGQLRIQAPRGRGVGQGARRQAGPVLQSAVPVARCRRVVAAPSAERLPHRPRAGPHRVSLQMRRPRHPRAGDAQAGRRAQHGRPARRRLSSRSGAGATSSCSAAASASRRWRRSRSSPAKTASASPRSCRARSPDFVMADDLFGEVGEVVSRARHRRHERGRERRGNPRRG